MEIQSVRYNYHILPNENYIDLLDYELFQKLLSFIPTLSPLKLVSRNWKAATEEQLFRRLPNEERQAILAVKKLTQVCNYFETTTPPYEINPKKRKECSSKKLEERKRQKKEEINEFPLPEEAFQHILSYVPELFPLSLVNKKWNSSTQMQITLRFPGEMKKTLEFIKSLVECHFFSKAESAICDILKLDVPPKKVFEYAIDNQLLLLIFRNFKKILEFEDKTECLSKLDNNIKLLYFELIKEIDIYLNSLKLSLIEYSKDVSFASLKLFYNHILVPFFIESCFRQQSSIAFKLLMAIEEMPFGEVPSKSLLALENYLTSNFSKRILKASSEIKDIFSKLEVAYAITYFWKNITYIEFDRFLSSILDPKNSKQQLIHSYVNFNFPVLFKILSESFIKAKYLELPANNIDSFYSKFKKNFYINFSYLEYYLTKNSTKPFFERFCIWVFCPLLIKACKLKHSKEALEMFKLMRKLENSTSIWNYSFKNCEKNFYIFLNFIEEISEIEKKLDFIKSIFRFYRNFHSQNLKKILDLFLIPELLVKIGEFEQAKSYEAKIFELLLKRLKDKSSNYVALQSLDERLFTLLIDLLINDNRYEDVEVVISFFKDINYKKAEEYYHLIINRKVKTCLDACQWKEARAAVYKLVESGFDSSNAEELLEKIENVQAEDYSKAQAEYRANYEVAEALKEQQSHYLDDNDEFLPSDMEYNPEDFSSGSDDEMEVDD